MAVCMLATVGASCSFERDTGGTSVDHTKVQLLVGNFNGGYGNAWLNKAVKRFTEKYKDYDFGNGKKGVQITIDDSPRYSGKIENTMSSWAQNVILAENVNYYNLVNIKDASSKYLVDISDVVNTPVNRDLITGSVDSAYANDTKTIGEIMNGEMRDYLNADENGKYYGVPFYEATVGIVYDLDVFEKYGFYYAAQGYGDAEGFIQDTDGNWIGEGGKVVGKASEMSYTDALKAGVKLGNGPDGKAGTYDDGCAATYDDFFKLCLRMNARDVFPLTWPGAQETLRYLNYLAYNLWTDYEGVDQMGLNYSLSGTASDLIKLDTYNAATGTYETESVAVTDANGYELQRQAGKYEAINFIKRILSDERNFDPKTCVSDTSQKDAERRFILSAAPDIKDRAMLIDGSWWQNEAKNMFEDMAVDYNNNAYRAENRRFGLLPLPKANASKVGEESALAFNTATVIFVNKKTTTDETTLKVAKQFIKFLHTHESLYEFTSVTSSARPYTYDLSDAEKSTLTSVAKHNYELHSATNFVFPYSKQTIVRSNYERFSCSGYLVFMAYGQQETILAQRFLNNKDTTSWDYFTSMVECQGKEFWETNFGKDIGK